MFGRGITILLSAVTLTFAGSHPSSSQSDPSLVSLNYGAFRGNISGDIVQFLGIPFAAPPVGDLRFAPPTPPVAFNGVRNATSFGPGCFQQMVSKALPFPLGTNPLGGVSEDCLFINVLKPTSIRRGNKLPVVMWIYGGGFEFGDTSANPGNSLVSRSIALGRPIIYVSANYRLNAFGFLGGKEVKAAGLGNIGLRDQRFAMEWVQKYISSFGGDPERVTIWGESAGAWSVGLHHVINDGVQGHLFRGSIMQSGAPVSLRTITSFQKFFDQLVNDTGCNEDSNALECLRKAPYANLTAAIDRTPNLLSFESLELAWEPAVDGIIIKRNPLVSIEKGLFSKVPIISGNCEDEGTLFSFSNMNITTDSAFLDYLHTNYRIPPKHLGGVARAYPSDVTQGSPFGTGTQNALTPQFKRLAAVQGDLFFQAPRRFFMAAMSKTQKTYAYLYQRANPFNFQPLGTFHTTDIPEFYGTGSSPDFVGTDALVNFVNTLNPNNPGQSNSNSSESLLQHINWAPWKSSSTRPSMLAFSEPEPNVTIMFDDYRKDAMNILNAILLEQAQSELV